MEITYLDELSLFSKPSYPSTSLARCKDNFVVFFAIENEIYLRLFTTLTRKSPEVLSNVRLTCYHYSGWRVFLQEFFNKKQMSSYDQNTPYVVGDEGLEPPTSSLSVTRSNQLS